MFNDIPRLPGRLILLVSLSNIVIIPAIAQYIDDYDQSGFDSIQLKKNNQRISGGYTAEVGEFPSFVGLKIMEDDEDYNDEENENNEDDQDNTVICGGVAISPRHVLTAAHCVDKKNIVFAAPGIWNPREWDEHRVKSYKVVRKLLRLEKPIRGIRPALLASSSVPMGFHAIVVGNGFDDGDEESHPSKLQKLPVERVDCPEVDKHPTRICFRSYDPKYKGDTCQGDSGGPVYGKSRDGRLVVVGLNSYGDLTCQKGVNGITKYADVYSGLQEITRLVDKCS